MAGWTVEIADEGAAFTDYADPFDLFFAKRLNGLGYHYCVIPGIGSNPVPTRGQVIRYVWEKGGANEKVHFEGFIGDARRANNGQVYVIRGFDLLGELWQSGQGGIRHYISATPHTIIQAAAAGVNPNGLLYNAQGTLVQTYGSAAAVPNKVTGGVPGTSLSFFKADSSKMLINIQRLALQARYGAALQLPAPADDDAGTIPPATTSYGLEFFSRLEGANNSTPTFYLVARRSRATGYTPESFNNPEDLMQTRRGFEGLTAAQAIRVIGQGDGQTRVESSLLGSGGLEGIIADKTVIRPTNATNMSNRLATLLNPTIEVVTGRCHKHFFATEVGDNITITETGVADTTKRVFEIAYSLAHRSFFITAGRPRPSSQTPIQELFALVESQAQANNYPGQSSANLSQPAITSFAALANNASSTVTLTFSNRDYNPDLDEAIQFYLQFVLTAGAGDVDLELDIPSGGTVFYRARHTAPGTSVFDLPIYLPSQMFVDSGIGGAQGNARLRLTNRTGGDIDGSVQLSAWVIA